jgi:hypothetical protein
LSRAVPHSYMSKNDGVFRIRLDSPKSVAGGAREPRSACRRDLLSPEGRATSWVRHLCLSARSGVVPKTVHLEVPSAPALMNTDARGDISRRRSIAHDRAGILGACDLKGAVQSPHHRRSTGLATGRGGGGVGWRVSVGAPPPPPPPPHPPPPRAAGIFARTTSRAAVSEPPFPVYALFTDPRLARAGNAAEREALASGAPGYSLLLERDVAQPDARFGPPLAIPAERSRGTPGFLVTLLVDGE